MLLQPTVLASWEVKADQSAAPMSSDPSADPHRNVFGWSKQGVTET